MTALPLLQSEKPKLHRVLAVLSAIGFNGLHGITNWFDLSATHFLMGIFLSNWEKIRVI